MVRQTVLVPIVIIVVLLLAAAGWYFVRAGDQARQEALSNAVKQRAGTLVQEVAEPFDVLSGQLRDLAKSRISSSCLSRVTLSNWRRRRITTSAGSIPR